MIKNDWGRRFPRRTKLVPKVTTRGYVMLFFTQNPSFLVLFNPPKNFDSILAIRLLYRTRWVLIKLKALLNWFYWTCSVARSTIAKTEPNFVGWCYPTKWRRTMDFEKLAPYIPYQWLFEFLLLSLFHRLIISPSSYLIISQNLTSLSQLEDHAIEHAEYCQCNYDHLVDVL